MNAASFSVRVAEIADVAQTIKRFKLVPADGVPLPAFSGGAHVVVTMRDGPSTYRNAYSLMSDPADTSAYEISVLKTLNSRGGSLFLHERVKEGDVLTISAPVNLFQPDWRARKHILIAGGIGITPFLAMMAQFKRQGIGFELHYGVRSRPAGAYLNDVLALYGQERVKIYVADEGSRIPVADILLRQPLGTHVSVCGPDRLIEATLQAGLDAGWPKTSLHAERFFAPPPGTPFAIDLSKTGRRIEVGEAQSILEALEAAGIEAPYLCRGGACGQCETAVVSCDGTLVHNDVYLSAEEKAAGTKIMICVSRMEGRCLTLNL